MASRNTPSNRPDPSSAIYNLIYWAGYPGRIESCRLVLEEAGAEYTDSGREGIDESFNRVMTYYTGSKPDDNINLPVLAPPILEHDGLVLSQMPNILQYLGRRLGLVPTGDNSHDNEIHALRVNQLALTALDGFYNEVQECHHPISAALYYEDQISESVRRSEWYVKSRLPKFLGYFERVLRSEPSGDGPWLFAGQLTYADLVLFQCIDGVKYMFPKAMARYENSGEYSHVLELYEAVKARPRIKAYLASDRRQKYSMGIFRYYEELDIDPVSAVDMNLKPHRDFAPKKANELVNAER